MKRFISVVLILILTSLSFAATGDTNMVSQGVSKNNLIVQSLKQSEIAVVDGTLITESIRITDRTTSKKSEFTLKKKILQNGNTIATVVENGVTTTIFYDDKLKQVYINGSLKPELSGEITLNNSPSSNLYRVTVEDVYPGDPGNAKIVDRGVTQASIPVGTAVTTALALISIRTGIPAGKLAQALTSLTSVMIGGAFDGILYYKIYQYRTKDKVTVGTIIPQYLFRNVLYVYYKSYSNCVAGPMDSGWWFQSKPY